MERLVRLSKRLGLLALAYLLVLAGTYIYCELAEPPGLRVDQAAKPLLSPAERAALHPDTRAGLEAYEAGDYTRAHALWLPRAKAGDAEAMFGMGRIYDVESTVFSDPFKARIWFEKAAKANHPNAQNTLGYYFSKGIGGEVNNNISLKLYKLSANSGIIKSAFNAVIKYKEKMEPAENMQEALYWLSKAAAKCHASALIQVGTYYFDGIIFSKNRTHSYTLTVLAKLNGDDTHQEIHVLYLFLLSPWEYIENVFSRARLARKP